MAVLEIDQKPIHDKMMKIVKKGDKKVYLVAQELKLAKVLAGNDANARDKALKNLKKWFENRSKTMPFTNEDFQRIWKGLFYCMWMSDKPLVQEDCADKIAKLVHLPTQESSLLFFKAGLTILINEWFGIDQLRMDKFLMLVRRLLRETLIVLRTHKLNNKNIKSFSDVLSDTILSTECLPPLGLFMHFVEIFMEELAKVTEGKMKPENTVEFLRPFIKNMVFCNDGRKLGHLRKFIFTYLIRQSNLGLEYQAKYEAWRQQGFPGSIDSMQRMKLDEDSRMSSDEEENSEKEKEKPLDPRAGRVNVEIPQIKFSPKEVSAALFEYKFDKNSTTKSRKMITLLAEQFTKLANGIYPLGVKKVEVADEKQYEINIRKAAKSLIKFDQKLLGKNKKRKRDKENEEQPEIETKIRKTVEIENDAFNTDVTKKALKRNKNDGKIHKTKDHNEQIKALKKTKKLTVIDSNKIKNNIEKANDRKKTTRKSSKENEINLDDIECVFERNSGTWVVYDVGEKNKGGAKTFFQSGSSNITAEIESIAGPSRSSDNGSRFNISPVKPNNQSSLEKSNETKQDSSSKKSRQSPKADKPDSENGSAKSGLDPVRLFDSPSKEKELFSKSEWDEPLREGEYEISISSKKYVAKMKKLGKKNNQSVNDIINSSLQNIKGKSRLSLDASLVKNPFSTPVSAKKVKINTRLNKSQEIHEHHAQILSSPAIPYDANKKPLKPLLKTGPTSTPINPFYHKLLNV